MCLDWRRLRRSTVAAVLSDDLPFVLWAAVLWRGFERLQGWVAASSLSAGLKRVLVHPVATSIAKTILTQTFYETVSTGLYLALQALLRGEGGGRAAAEVRAKFWSAWTDGVVFFTAANAVTFLLYGLTLRLAVTWGFLPGTQSGST